MNPDTNRFEKLREALSADEQRHENALIAKLAALTTPKLVLTVRVER